jgi:hypothetical protein
VVACVAQKYLEVHVGRTIANIERPGIVRRRKELKVRPIETKGDVSCGCRTTKPQEIVVGYVKVITVYKFIVVKRTSSESVSNR